MKILPRLTWEDKLKRKIMKKRSLVKQFRNDDPSTYLTNTDQQKAMLLETIEDVKPKKINKFVEPELNGDISGIAENRLKYEALRINLKGKL